jgi:hypothetical protein
MRSKVDVAAAREALLDWIETHWNTLAALAWRGYVTEGRGIVLLQGDWSWDVAAAYQTARHVGTGWPDELVGAVQDYTPATDIIFVVQHDLTATLLGMRATPPRLPPGEAGQQNGAPHLVPSA